MTYLYKWMLPGLITPMVKKRWPVGVGEWTPKENPVLCESGWHGIVEKNVLSHLTGFIGAELWLVETKGKMVHGDDKFASESMRLVQHVGTTDERNLRLFACDCAEDALSLIDNPDPQSVEAIAVARRFAVGDATVDELSAAESAAWSAARSAAEYAARSAAESAAESAAWSAAEYAARSAAESAAWSAARSAAIEKYSNWLVVRLWDNK